MLGGKKDVNNVTSQGGGQADSITDKAAQTVLAHKNKTSGDELEDNKTSDPIEKKKRKKRTTKIKPEEQEAAKIAEQLDKLFDPRIFKGVVRAPADLMLAATGRKIWDLPDKEVDTLAESGSICAQQFIKTDPKWIALIMFSMSLISVYGGRAAFHYREVSAEKKQNNKKPEVVAPSGKI